MKDSLKIDRLTKKFPTLTAVSSLSLTVPPGTVYALTGPNGSGKTTLLNCVVGLLKPDSGEIHIGGVDVHKKPTLAKHLFAYISDNPAIYPYLTGMEFIYLNAGLRGLSKTDTEKKINEIKKIFPIEEILSARAESYSRGNIEKAAFLSAIVSEPPLLIIDEPIVGLDPKSIEIFGDTLRDYVSGGRSVFISTHTLSFAKKFADKIGIMSKGKLVHELDVRSNTDVESLYDKYTA